MKESDGTMNWTPKCFRSTQVWTMASWPKIEDIIKNDGHVDSRYKKSF